MAPRAFKRKREAESANQPFAIIILLTTGFKEATTILANLYQFSYLSQLLQLSGLPTAIIKALEKRLDQMEVNIQNIVDKILYATTAPSPSPVNNDALEKEVDQIKNNIENMVGKALQALVRLNTIAGLRPLTVRNCLCILIILDY